MKVYTHFTEINEGESDGFRWRTLMQFGNSWNIIGSIVMLNPGSARPKADPITQGETLKKLSAFDASDDPWYEFTDDPTMRNAADLFAFKYGCDRNELQGVIQIFNLFYLRDADLDRAVSNGLRNKVSGEEDYAQLVAPVYLGFGQLAQSPEFKDRAKKFFDRAVELGMNNIDPNYGSAENKFYHPRYLFVYGHKRDRTRMELARFKENTLNPSREALNSAARFLE